MSSSVERAARALCRLDGNAENIPFNGQPMWKSYIPEVHAVLTHLRDPSTEMIAAADSLSCAVDTTAQWQAMIDTAIVDTGFAPVLEPAQSSCN